jgi:hypothetical protein
MGNTNVLKGKHLIPAGRQALILGWLEEQGSLSIQDLQDRLGVSHMTVHRDLTTLEATGSVRKVRGGVMLAAETADARRSQQNCQQCGMRIPARSEVQLTGGDKRKSSACCPHCGILMMMQDTAFSYALARDFLHSRMTNMRQASFLVGSEVQTCCVPSILCFASADEAAKFQQGFGGMVMAFDQLWRHMLQTHVRDHAPG